MLFIWIIGLCLLCATDATDCPNFWIAYNDSCYRFGHQQITFFEAESYCRQHNGRIVHIETVDENNFLKQELTDLIAPKWWIGLADDDVEGTFVWYGTNDKPTFTDWSPGNPSDSGSNEDCGEFDKNGGNGLQWNDVNCHALRPVICESVGGSEVIG